MGPDNALCSFRDDQPLAGLLHRLAEEPEAPPIELILAGDLFDFLQVEGYDGFDAARSAERFERILGSPRTTAVAVQLRRLASRPRIEVVVLSGNHDPELLVPAVRERFEDVIGRRGTVFWADDKPLRPQDGERLPVWGHALGEEGRRVWVIHGDRWDPHNFIDRAAVRAAIAAGQPVELPVGSHLVFEVLQKLKPTYPWIDQLKPEEAVMELLIYLDPGQAREFLRRHAGIGAGVFRGKVQARLYKGPLFGAGDPAGPVAPPTLDAQLAALVAEAIAEAPEASRNVLLAELQSHLQGAAAPAPGTLAEHGGLLRRLLRHSLDKIRRSERFQEVDGPDSIPDDARWSIPEEVVALVAGHTHGPRSRGDIYPAYFNSGTWLPVGRIPRGDLKALIDQVEKGPTWPSEAPRTFVQVELGDGIPVVRLLACNENGESRENRP